MSPSHLSGEAGVNPLSPLEQLARMLLNASIHTAAAVLIGILAARTMRRWHLHWSWAAIALALVALAKGVLRGATPALAATALSATVYGWRWHREDIEAGADLAETAARRRGPAVCLRWLARRATLPAHARAGAGRWLRDDGLVLGYDHLGRTATIPFARGTGGAHSLVVGSTGSGKTVTQTWIAARAIERGMGAIVLDPKGDRGLRRELLRAAQLGTSQFIEWTPDGPCVYNPFARGSETEIADKALAGERFTEPHYLRQAQRHLGHVVRALRKLGVEVSLAEIVSHLDPVQLECAARNLPESEAESTHAYLDSLTPRQQNDLAGVRNRLAILAESDAGRWLDPHTAGAGRFDLLETAQSRCVVYFDLESDRRPLLAQMLGAAIVQDLQTMVASMQARPVPTLVVIDEFSAIATDQVVRLFRRARSAGVSLLLGTQELADLRPPGRERLLEQVLGNLSALVAHRQVVPESAELIASLAGTRGSWRTSQHADGSRSRVRTRINVLDANEVMNLQQGCAAVLVLAGGRRTRTARIFSPRSDP